MNSARNGQARALISGCALPVLSSARKSKKCSQSLIKPVITSSVLQSLGRTLRASSAFNPSSTKYI